MYIREDRRIFYNRREAGEGYVVLSVYVNQALSDAKIVDEIVVVNHLWQLSMALFYSHFNLSVNLAASGEN